jgi:hypothetical protein
MLKGEVHSLRQRLRQYEDVRDLQENRPMPMRMLEGASHSWHCTSKICTDTSAHCRDMGMLVAQKSCKHQSRRSCICKHL